MEKIEWFTLDRVGDASSRDHCVLWELGRTADGVNLHLDLVGVIHVFVDATLVGAIAGVAVVAGVASTVAVGRKVVQVVTVHLLGEIERPVKKTLVSIG